MKAWTRRHTLIAGVLLIAAANAVALGNVAWNRSPPPESELRITERELQPGYSSMGRAENSGMSLRLQWRVLASKRDMSGGIFPAGAYGTPEWLDNAKLAELGFDVNRPLSIRRQWGRGATREVVLVLELDGSAYRTALTRTQAYAEKKRSELAAFPGSKEHENNLRAAERAVQDEERVNSRLFAVDAGLDAAALRSRYPDRARYALMHGRVRMDEGYGVDRPFVGTIAGLSIDEVNVPLPMRSQIATQAMYAHSEPFEATLAVGRRLEPWLLSLQRRPAQ
jgi:hypothetical protein